MLHERYPAATLAEVLLPRADFRPFPSCSERGPWEGLPAEVRASLIAEGEAALDFSWPPVLATHWLDYPRTGDRSRHQEVYFSRRRALLALVLAECSEGRGRFLDAVLDGVWSLCEETSWVIPAHNRFGAPLPPVGQHDIDLFAAETGAVLAWTHYLLGEPLTALTSVNTQRLRSEVTTRILEPFMHGSFWWTGADGSRPNNWNPWCTSNCLAAGLLLEDDPARRVAFVERALVLLDRFLAGYSADGGCDEGPSYWSVAAASLYDALELLAAASAGRIDIFGEPLIGEMGRYLVRVFISNGYFVNFADAPARVATSGDLLYRWGRRLGDAPLMALGAHAAHAAAPARSLHGWRSLAAIFNQAQLPELDLASAFLRDVWLPDTQLMAAREQAGSDRGLYLAAKGGHNDESHNHNDVGSFLVYLDGRPLLVDPGVERYTSQTFGPHRYDLWTMQSAYHNLPTFSGVQQEPGQEFRASEVAYAVADTGAEFSLNLASAYPPSAGLERWFRTCRLVRGAAPAVEIVDEFTLTAPSDGVTLTLMTPCEPSANEPGTIVLAESTGLRAVVTYDAAQLQVEFERLPLEDEHLLEVWGDHLHRVLLRPVRAVREGRWVLRITRA